MSRKGGFWIIVDGSTPTAFRARERDELVPTLRQLQRTQPASVLCWFDRGRLWESPEQAAAVQRMRDERRRERGPDWRPGGKHEDPRARYELSRDQKRARFKKRQTWHGKSAPGAPPSGGESGRPPGHQSGRPPGHQSGRPPGHQSGRPPGHQSGRPPGHQSGRPPGRQSGRPPGHASGRSSGHQAGRPAGRPARRPASRGHGGKGRPGGGGRRS